MVYLGPCEENGELLKFGLAVINVIQTILLAWIAARFNRRRSTDGPAKRATRQ